MVELPRPATARPALLNIPSFRPTFLLQCTWFDMPNQARIPTVSPLSVSPCAYRISLPRKDPKFLFYGLLLHMTNRPQFSSVYRACVRLRPGSDPNRCFTPRKATVGPMPEVPGALIGWFSVLFGSPDLFAYPQWGTFAGFGLPRFKCPIMIRVLPVTRGPAARSRIAPPWSLQPL